MIIKYNFNLTDFNSYKINTVCSKAYFPESENDIFSLFSELSSHPLIIGNGNNIIFSKEFYDNDFLIFNGNFDNYQIENSIISAQAGTTLETLSQIAAENSLSGLEIFYDIPSSVGGAVVMNAGTKEIEIKDILLKVRYLDLVDLKIKEINTAEIHFEYRNSFFQKNTDKIVLKAWFQLKKGNRVEIKNTMESAKQLRWEKQPREYPNCGSVFKRPPGRFVGPMIDELGLKGFTIGGAKISEKHSGFIVNIGNASGKDILNIISVVQERVKEKFGVDLEVEQRII